MILTWKSNGKILIVDMSGVNWWLKITAKVLIVICTLACSKIRRSENHLRRSIQIWVIWWKWIYFAISCDPFDMLHIICVAYHESYNRKFHRPSSEDELKNVTKRSRSCSLSHSRYAFPDTLEEIKIVQEILSFQKCTYGNTKWSKFWSRWHCIKLDVAIKFCS